MTDFQNNDRFYVRTVLAVVQTLTKIFEHVQNAEAVEQYWSDDKLAMASCSKYKKRVQNAVDTAKLSKKCAECVVALECTKDRIHIG